MYGQLISVVSPTNETKIYTELKKAVDEAPEGSMIYLPGGKLQGDFEISKKVNLIGVGYNQDLNPVNGNTKVNGSLIFLTGSDGSSVIGMHVDNIYIGREDGAEHLVDNLLIKQCQIYQMIQRTPHYTVFGGNGLIVDQCILTAAFQTLRVKKATLTNNVFTRDTGEIVSYLYDSKVKNNIFYSTNPLHIKDVDPNADFNHTNIVENNIFVNGILPGYNSVSFLSFKNNIICNDLIKEGNFSNVDKNSLFKEGTHKLQDNSPYKDKGTDGKEIGIYGGSGWVEGGIPFNPHIESSDVAAETSADGTLRVKIKVTVGGK